MYIYCWINVTPKGVYLPISKLHSILAVANLLIHNIISQICYCGQYSLQSAAGNCSFSDNPTPLEVTIILLAIVRAFSMRFLTIKCMFLFCVAWCDHFVTRGNPLNIYFQERLTVIFIWIMISICSSFPVTKLIHFEFSMHCKPQKYFTSKENIPIKFYCNVSGCL